MMASDLSQAVATTQLTSVGDEGRRKSSELLAGPQDVSPTTTATSSTSTTTSSSSPVDPQLLMFLNSVEFHHDYTLVLSANTTDDGEKKNNSNKAQTQRDDTGESEALPEDCAADPFASSAPASASSFQSSAASSSNNNVAMVGSGSFGSILLCTPKFHKVGKEEHRGTKNNNNARSTSSVIPLQQCVVKVHSFLSGAEESAAAVAKSSDPLPNKDELAVLRQIGTHPHLLPLLDCYPMRNTATAALATSQSKQQQHALVFPWVSGGDLFDEVGLRGHYPEAQGRDLLFGLLQGLAQMHRAGIAHRDVKPENILLSPPTSSSQRPTHGILADFGLAGAVPAKDCCGSPLYAAPELLVATRNQKAYTAKVDLYSLGIVAYAVLTGGVPFCGTPDELFKHTLHSPPPFKARGGWSAVSSEGTEFVRLLLTKDPTKRPTAEEALAHPWFSGGLKHHHQKPPPLVQLATNPSSPQGCKARTTSPATPNPRVNCDRTTSLTRSWYNKSKVERTSSCSVDGDELKVKKTLGHGSPPPFPKMGSVAGLRELYGGAATHAVVGVGMGASSSPCPGSSGEHSDDGLFTRHNSNSAPTLSLSPTPVQHITQATAEAGPTASGDFDELGGARGTPLDG